MIDPELIHEASPGIKAVAPGFFASLGIWLRAGQERKMLESDQAFARELLQTGPENFRFRGSSMELETFVDAGEQEAERLATNVVNALLKADSVVDWSKVDLDNINPEFRRRWVSEASNVSDETLQDLWARLLAGELESPRSVSNDTMSITRDMTKERAEEFQLLCSSALYGEDGTPFLVVSCGHPGRNSLSDYGLSFDVLTRLAHHRLIVGEVNTNKTLPNHLLETPIGFRHQGRHWTIQSATKPDPNTLGRSISGVLFTPAGDELSRVVEHVPMPEYTAAMVRYLNDENWLVRSVV